MLQCAIVWQQKKKAVKLATRTPRYLTVAFFRTWRSWDRRSRMELDRTQK